MLVSAASGLFILLLINVGSEEIDAPLSIFWALTPFAATVINSPDLDDWERPAGEFFVDCFAAIVYGFVYGGVVYVVGLFSGGYVLPRLGVPNDQVMTLIYVLDYFLLICGAVAVRRLVHKP
jgi:hypothetical protein